MVQRIGLHSHPYFSPMRLIIDMSLPKMHRSCQAEFTLLASVVPIRCPIARRAGRAAGVVASFRYEAPHDGIGTMPTEDLGRSDGPTRHRRSTRNVQARAASPRPRRRHEDRRAKGMFHMPNHISAWATCNSRSLRGLWNRTEGSNPSRSGSWQRNSPALTRRYPPARTGGGDLRRKPWRQGKNTHIRSLKNLA